MRAMYCKDCGPKCTIEMAWCGRIVRGVAKESPPNHKIEIVAMDRETESREEHQLDTYKCDLCGCDMPQGVECYALTQWPPGADPIGVWEDEGMIITDMIEQRGPDQRTLMKRTKGRYDEDAENLLKLHHASGVVLLVFFGDKGSGFSVATIAPELVLELPSMLRNMADQIEKKG